MEAHDALGEKAKAVIHAWVDAWNADDLDAMAALFAADAHWINIVGMHWRGRDQIDAAHRAYFDLMFRGVDVAIEEIESIALLPGDSAIMVVRLQMGAFTQPDGVVRPPSRDRLTLVLAPQGEGLAIAHGANIAILEEAQPFNPIRE